MAMSTTDMMNLLLITPEIRRAKRVYLPNGQHTELLSSAEAKKVITEYIPIVTRDVLMRNDWDFALDVVSKSTVKDQSEYTLDESQDILQVHSIRYKDSDDNFIVLERKSQTAMDDLLSNYTVDAVQFWAPLPKLNTGFPRVAILSAPPDATHTLQYRFWRELNFSQMPSQFHPAIIAGVKAQFDSRFKTVYDDEVRNLIDDFKEQDPDANELRLDPHLAALNRRRLKRISFGG